MAIGDRLLKTAVVGTGSLDTLVVGVGTTNISPMSMTQHLCSILPYVRYISYASIRTVAEYE